jgi:hypothetical protein
MPAVKKFTITPLKFDQNVADLVTRRRTDGESISTIAKSLKLSAGKTAMFELLGTTERVVIEDPAKLARAITKDRAAGRSWGWLAARYGVTEGTCRAAYTAATGKPFAELDYRRKAKQDKPAAAPIKRGGVKAARTLAAKQQTSTSKSAAKAEVAS